MLRVSIFTLSMIFDFGIVRNSVVLFNFLFYRYFSFFCFSLTAVMDIGMICIQN